MTLDQFGTRPRRTLSLGNLNSALAVRGHVTPRIGGRYVLAGVTLYYRVSSINRIGFQVYVADDNDLTDLTNLTGDQLFTGPQDFQGGEQRDLRYFPLMGAARFEPMLLVTRASSYLKAKVHTLIGGAPYLIHFDLATP